MQLVVGLKLELNEIAGTLVMLVIPLTIVLGGV